MISISEGAGSAESRRGKSKITAQGMFEKLQFAHSNKASFVILTFKAYKIKCVSSLSAYYCRHEVA